ncbi:sigma-70 family RNA polymerase sigma factor [Streptomycetaceae bacterium NBC_01309]
MCLFGIDVVSESRSSSEGATADEAAGKAGHHGGADAAADVDFESVRSRLFGIAYRQLGRVADAEDVVQDVWLRWQSVDRARVQDCLAFLVTVTTRVALNAATSARARHEISVEDWSPKPAPGSADPAPGAERREALESAVRLLMERLPPVERAVYILREAFEYPFREIADLLGVSEGNARQLAFRARRHLARRRRHPVDAGELDGLLEAFLDAARRGNMARLIGLFKDLRTPPSRENSLRTARPGEAAERVPVALQLNVRAACAGARSLMHHEDDPGPIRGRPF